MKAENIPLTNNFAHAKSVLALTLIIVIQTMSADLNAQERKLEAESAVTTTDYVTVKGREFPTKLQPVPSRFGVKMASPQPHFFMFTTGAPMLMMYQQGLLYFLSMAGPDQHRCGCT